LDFELTRQQQEWVAEARAFLRQNPAPKLDGDEWDGYIRGYSPLARAFLRKVVAKGWYGLALPKEYGGLQKSAVEHFLFIEEFDYSRNPVPDRMTTVSVGPAIMRHGTEAQKRRWIPEIVRGELTFALGYSEPDAGTDLASLCTRAVLDGDEWVINGKKIWNSAAHFCTHEWLACRTDPDAPKHRGISVIIVPIDAPGVTIRSIETWGDYRTNETSFDNVRVPKDYLVGEVNRGWYHMTTALNFERLAIGGTGQLRRMLEDLVIFCKQTAIDGEVLAQKPTVRYRLAELEIALEVARLFSMRTAWMIDEGLVPDAEASMTKVYTSELRARLSDSAMQIMALYGQLGKHDPAAPDGGWIEDNYRRAPMQRFGAGTNEIMRNIIALRGLGLPR